MSAMSQIGLKPISQCSIILSAGLYPRVYPQLAPLPPRGRGFFCANPRLISSSFLSPVYSLGYQHPYGMLRERLKLKSHGSINLFTSGSQNGLPTRPPKRNLWSHKNTSGVAR